MRQALWPDATVRTHRREIDRFFAGTAREPLAVFVAEAESARGATELVGFVELSLRAYAQGCETSPVGYVEGWFVAPEWRRQGLGTALLRAGERWARARGCREMASDTEPGNRRSRHAHRAAGYDETGTVVCFRRVLRSQAGAQRRLSDGGGI